MKLIKKWISENKLETALLIGILLLSAYFRLYKISGYMTFLGDEGRDAIIVRRLLVDFDPILIGPGTSIGNMYLGPLYYYFIAPGLLLARFSPVGPAVSVALLGVATVFFIWFVVREGFYMKGIHWGALVASFLYGISPTVIIFSRSSWNPNIMPFFALLSIYSAWRVWSRGGVRWILVEAVAFAFVLQSHYLGLLLAPVLGIYWFLAMLGSKGDRKRFWGHTVVGALVFIFLMSPLVIFDFRHGFMNFEAMKVFFTVRQTTVSARPWNGIPGAWPIMQDVATRLLAGRNEAVGRWVALALVGGVAYVLLHGKKHFGRLSREGLVLTSAWLGFAILGLGLLKQQIYDHYYGFFFPVPFILVGMLVVYLITRAKVRGWWIVLFVFIFLSYFSLINRPIKGPPNMQLSRSVAVAKKIETEAGGKPFNLAVIAERNYEDAYQYFLEVDGVDVVDIDATRYDETVTDQLFVVCELPVEECDPTHNEKTGIANFGWSEILETWRVEGVTLFKLGHTQ